MKVVILAGGLGTRLSEETDIKPKPMVAEDPVAMDTLPHKVYLEQLWQSGKAPWKIWGS